MAKKCTKYIRQNLEEVSLSNNFTYLSDAGLESVQQAIESSFTASLTPEQLARETEKRLTTLALVSTRQNRLQTEGQSKGDVKTGEEEEEIDREDRTLSLSKAEKLWRSLFWNAMVGMVSEASKDVETIMPLRTAGLLSSLRKRGEDFEVLHFPREPKRRHSACNGIRAFPFLFPFSSIVGWRCRKLRGNKL